MSKPELVMAERTNSNSLTDLHAIAIGVSEDSFREMGHTPPVWVLGLPDGVMAIVTPFENNREQEASLDVIACLLKVFDCHAYSMAIEAWAVQIRAESNEDVDKVRAAMPDRLDKLPLTERDEILMIHSRDKGGDWMSCRYMIFSGSKKPFLGPRIDDNWQGEGVTTEGRMTNLFDRVLPPEAHPLIKLMVASFMAKMAKKFS